ncbi:MAG TPA: hypothetical protein VMV79_02530 [Alphaproteobacteria bacterium]|nr:hypothetical protein [Alphaproteobacteria bacterium]
MADDNVPLANVALAATPQAQTSLDKAEQHARLGLLFNYVRQETPAWLPGLPAALRAPLGWAGIGFGGGADDAVNTFDLLPSFLAPMQSLMHGPDPRAAEAMWLAPGYHHRGFLPFNDAITMGVGYRDAFFGNRLKIDLRPFYGQNWVSPRGFWGTEITLGIGPDAKRSWGKVVMRYDNGAPGLMGNSERGFTMGTELSFTDHLSLDAGVRGGEETQLGNYAMLRWRVADLDR